MSFTRLGTLTIGESPRSDIAPILERHLPQRVTHMQLGLLDGLDDATVTARFGAQAGERVLVTRRRDGSSVALSASKVERELPAALRRLEEAGCDVIVLLCTGAFRGLACDRAWLLEPERILPAVVGALAGARQVGVIMPLVAQVPDERGKWRLLARPPLFDAASPYEADVSVLLAAGEALRARGAELLVLDCIGFVEWHRARLAAATDLPVVLSNVVVARVAAELFGE